MADSLLVRVVVNPVSGRRGRLGVVRQVCRRIRDAGWSVLLHETRGPGDAAKVAKQACQDCARALVVVGGDGTVSEAAGGMVGQGVPILVVPSGTENILAKYLGMRSDADWLWRVLWEGQETSMDIPAMNGRRFLLVAGVGFDAEVVAQVARRRSGHSGHIDYLSYFWPVWRTFWGHRYPRVFVEADGELLPVGRGLVFVGNVPRYAIGLRILGVALPDDGLLDVCVFRCSWQGPLLGHAIKVLAGVHIGSRGVTYRHARRVRVWAEEPVPVQLDGDAAGWLPAEFEMTTVPARFLVQGPVG